MGDIMAQKVSSYIKLEYYVEAYDVVWSVLTSRGIYILLGLFIKDLWRTCAGGMKQEHGGTFRPTMGRCY